MDLAGSSHVARRLCDLEGRLPVDSVMSDSFLFWSTWRRQLSRLDTAAELIPQVWKQRKWACNLLHWSLFECAGIQEAHHGLQR